MAAQIERLHEVLPAARLAQSAACATKASKRGPAGIKAMLPHVDDFLPVHNLESLTELAAALDRAPHAGASGHGPRSPAALRDADGDDQHARSCPRRWRPSGRRSTIRRCSRACIPGCESLEPDGENAYRIALAARIGPVAAKFTGRMQLSDIDPPQGYTLSFDGQGGAAGFAKGDAKVALAPAENGAATSLSYTVNAQVGGKIAQIGSRLVDGAAQKLADDFFAPVLGRRCGQGRGRARGRRGAGALLRGPRRRWVRYRCPRAHGGADRLPAAADAKIAADGGACAARLGSGLMDSVDLEVLKRCADWLDAGRRVLLVTVVKTWGSSPRPPGAMLAVRDDGLVEGSVSGGCIEDDIVGRVRADGMTATRLRRRHLRRVRRRSAPLRTALRRARSSSCWSR